MSRPPILDYQHRDYRPAPSGRPIFSLTAFIACALAVALGSAFLLGFVPFFEATFRDFKATLPAFTQGYLAFARGFRAFGWAPAALVPVAWGFLTPLLFAGRLDSSPAQRRTRRFFAIRLAMVALMIFLAISALALFLPLVSLVQSLTK